MKTLLFSLSSSEVFKNQVFFPGSFCDRLHNWLITAQPPVEVVFVIQKKDESIYRPYLIEKFGHQVKIETAEVPVAYHWWSRIFYFFYSYLVYTDTTRVLSTMAMRIEDAPGAGRRLLNPLKISINRLFGRSRWIKVKLVPFLFNFFFLARPFRRIFDTHHIDVVFVPDLFRRFDQELLAEARRRKIETVGMVTGWDHFDKYFLPLHVDTLLVQSEQLRGFALQYQAYKPREVITVGYPYLDLVTAKNYLRPRDEVLRSLGFPSNAKYVLYIAGTMYCPDEADIIARLLTWADEGTLRGDLHVVLRPYPGARGKDLTFDRQKFEAFRNHPRVSFVMEKFWGDLDKTYHFLNILYHADVVFAVYSTAALEAVALDRPAITLSFDGDRERPLAESVRRFALREHFKQVLATGGLRQVTSFADLQATLKAYLANPSTDGAKRDRLRQEILYRLDGQTSGRIFEVVKNKLTARDHDTRSIFLLNCDWRNIFADHFSEFEDKMKRDQLRPETNRFFVLSFARLNYVQQTRKFFTRHLKTRLDLFRPLLDLRAFFAVSYNAWHYRQRPDIWLTYDFGFLPALWLARRLFGGTIVMVLTNQPVAYSRARRFGWIKGAYSFMAERLFHVIPDVFMTLNASMKQYLVTLGVPDQKIKIFLTDTIVRDKLLIAGARTGAVRQKLGLAKNSKILLSIGRLEAEKNFFQLLQLFTHLSLEYVLVILGQGSLEQSLREQAERLGIASRVFFEGFVARERIWDYYTDADVFVLLSTAEALGAVFWEAMYLGTPVIGSTASGIVETVGHDGDRGRLWREEDGLEAFKERVAFCQGSSDAKKAMVERARLFVEEQITSRASINDFI